MSPAYLSYSPSTGPRQLGGDATRLTVSIRPPPGLEHLSEKNPSPLLLPMPGPKFGEHTQHTPSFPPFPPPDVAAPHLELEETPPAPSVEPCIRLALLEFLPNSQGAGHDPSSCRPCAFYHNKGCTLGSTQRVRDAILCADCVSYALAAMPPGLWGQNGSKCSFCHICPPGEKKRRQKLRRKAGTGYWTAPCELWLEWGRRQRKLYYIYLIIYLFCFCCCCLWFFLIHFPGFLLFFPTFWMFSVHEIHSSLDLPFFSSIFASLVDWLIKGVEIR